ncbi:MAG: energy transducer TonB [Bacteroidales bacterium]
MKNIFLFFIFTICIIVLQAQTTDSTHTESKDISVFNLVEKQPEFPGGEQALLDYIGSNIHYPKKARRKNIQGTVYVSFIIETDGNVSSVRVLRGIGGGCDEEAVRVVTLMPDWKPGYQRGKPVRVQFNLPIRFILDD